MDQEKEQGQADELSPDEKELLGEMEKHHAEMKGEGAKPEPEKPESEKETPAETESESGEEAEMILQPETIEALGKALNALLIDVLAYIKRPTDAA